jgi:hypothetical protein
LIKVVANSGFAQRGIFEVNENSRLIGCLRSLFKFTLSLPRSAKPQNVSYNLGDFFA